MSLYIHTCSSKYDPMHPIGHPLFFVVVINGYCHAGEWTVKPKNGYERFVSQALWKLPRFTPA